MALVDEYVVSAAPVGSSRIAQQHFKDVSTATIRNELMTLETEGYASSPHTSAGRIPTNIGYRVFVNTLLLRSEFKIEDQGVFSRAIRLSPADLNAMDQDQRIDTILADLSDATGLLSVLWWVKPDSVVHHRGMPQLLAQPEFRDSTVLIPLMQLLEDESALANLFISILKGKGFIVKVGIEDNDGRLSSYSVIADVLGKDQVQGVIALFGPTRMDYRKAIPTILQAQRLLNTARSWTHGW
jgi:transcriptional regulator of heat shock response